jgi:DNA-binding response OmpR family regulator
MTPLSVLVVAPTSQLAANLMEWLTQAGCAVILVTSFSAGKSRLEHGPSLVISEVRLGDYNGLHLALRAKASRIPALVIGGTDPVLQREAERLGVAYLTHELDRAQLLSVIERLVRSGAVADEKDHSAASSLAFMSWGELVPAVADRDPAASPRRRTLGS